MYEVLKVPIIFFIVRIIIGNILIFGNNTLLKKIKDQIILIYYGLIGGATIGYLVKNGIFGMVIGSIIVLLILLCIYKYYNYNNVINFIIFFEIFYMIADTFIYLFEVDLSEITGKYEDLLVNYTNIHIKLIFALTFSVIAMIISMKSGAILAKLVKDKIKYILIGNFFIMGAIFTGTGAPFYMSGEWEDFFIPLLNVNYEPEIFFIPVIETVFVIIFTIKKRYREKENVY